MLRARGIGRYQSILREVKEMMENEMTEHILIEQVMNQLKNVLQKIETRKADLEIVTAQCNQLEGEIGACKRSRKTS